MRARVFDPRSEPVAAAYGSILAADARADGGITLRKGVRLGPEHERSLQAVGVVHLVTLDPGELEQDAAAIRLAAAVAGPGTRVDPPSQGQARVRASARGRVRVSAAAVAEVNRRHPLLLFTVSDGQIAAEGDDVAGAKTAALATDERLVEEAEAVCRVAPVVSVAPFAARRVAVIVTDRLQAPGRAIVRDAIGRKIAWFGSTLVDLAEPGHERAAVASALANALALGADLVLVSGGSPLDPLDPVLLAIEVIGGRVLRTGVPAHPGSMVWVGALPAVPVLGIAACAGFGKDTALDLLLARVLSGDAPDAAADALGTGGLAEGAAPGSPYPPYAR